MVNFRFPLRRADWPGIRSTAGKLLLTILLLSSALLQKANAQGCANPIACENALQGDTDWRVNGSGDTSIQGFATDISVNAGQTVSFKINTNASNYAINIYRLGYYAGAGARKVATITPSVNLPQTQPACLSDSSTNLVDCGNWAVTASWQVPSNAVSGLYFAVLFRADLNDASQIFFVVRNDARNSDLLVQTSDETWAAYNPYGGHSLYGGPSTFDLNNRAFKVSYNRPNYTRTFEDWTFLFNAEYPMIRWLEANGYDATYFTNVDAVRNAGLMTNHKVVLSVGHDEYTSLQRRNNTEAARDAGVNLAFFSGNEFFWKTRWENSIDGSNTPYRTLVCYKETYQGSGILYQKDPLNPPTWTGTWRDMRSSPPSDGGRPENAVTSTLFVVNGPGADNTRLSIQVPAADGKMRFWRNTSVAGLAPGQTATLLAGSLGYEWDADIDNGFRPAGLVPLSTSTYTLTNDLLLDYGATYGPGNATHHLSLYRAPSGALVFGAGTVQWSWGLDSDHDEGNDPADIRMRQATVNLFADMGAQPATLQAGLVPATKSTDTTPPSLTITTPAPGSTVASGSQITITGTASDAGGGVVGAVEVSTDNGQTWHPAAGRASWSYQWVPWSGSSSATILARASDDSANLQQTPTGATYTVSGSRICPCSIWDNSTVPGTPSANDPYSVELGVKFRSDVSGFASGVRFYKGAGNTGTHIGNLWDIHGNNLASVNFTNETATGWQQASFPSPVALTANTTYIVSYYAPNGGYATDEPFFSSAVDRPPLHALATGTDGGNGLYIYASGGGFPNGTFNAGNYWVDVVFTTSSASAFSISGTISPAASGAGSTVTLSGPSSLTVTADSSGKYTFSNLSNGSYTVTPTKSGTTFAPVNAPVTVNGANVSGINFTASAVPTFSISGSVTPAASGSGTNLALTGASTASATANSSGNFSFPSLSNGNYTVTPSKTGLTFTPANANVTVSGSNVTGVAFTAAAAPTWSISGTITPAAAGAGSIVSLTGAASASATANASGTYSFTGLANGSYTVTPSKAGLSFAPASTNVTLSGANATANFSATQAFSIWSNSAVPANPAVADGSAVELGLKFRSDSAGLITAIRFYKGSGNNGVHVGNLWNTSGTKLGTVSFSGETTTGWQQAALPSPVAISANTTYVVSYLAPNGNYAANGAFFASTGVDSPPLHALANGADGPNGLYLYGAAGGFPTNSYNATNYWVDVVFTPSVTYSISGTITGGAASTVTLSGTSSATVTADSSGNYSLPGLANGTYTVTPSKTGSTFTPASANITISGANVTQNFTAAAAPTWGVSGSIAPAATGSGAVVNLSGPSTASTTANASGAYAFSNLANGTYTVTPVKTGVSFTPPNASVPVNGANVSGVNFTAATAPTWSITGTITPAASGNGSTVTLSGAASATVTANSSGNYTFTGLANGSYTVTPTKAGFNFTPANRSLTISSANATAAFTAAAAITTEVNVSRDQATAAANVTAPAFSTTTGNQLLLGFVSTDYLSGANTTVTSVTGAGLTWALVRRTNVQSGTSEIWRAFATAPLSNVTVSANLSQSVSSALTILSFAGVDTSGTNGSGAIGATGTGNARPGAPTATLTTTRNNSVIVGVGNDFDNPIARTVGPGQTLVHQYLAPVGDTYWVQRIVAPVPSSGTSVSVNDTAPTADRYNLTICEVRTAP